jgi:hypothetical protein
MRAGGWIFVALVASACTGSGSAPPNVAPAPEAKAIATEAPPAVTPAVAPSEALDASSATAKTEEDSATDSAAAPPPKVARSGRVWPFHAWDRAEAVTFNEFSMRPRTQLRAYDEHGWSPHIKLRKPVDERSASQAIDIVKAMQGEVEVSKCPFPRHAVVFYEGDVPVASANICFECGDILLWPAWGPPPEESEKQLKIYEKHFPRWKSFFRSLEIPTDKRYSH